MARPVIVQKDDVIGFYWTTPEGRPVTLSTLLPDDEEPDRLVATHLEAIDDVLIDVAGRFGEILGGGREPHDSAERLALRDAYRAIDRLTHEYADGLRTAEIPAEIRSGQIIGTATLMSIGARRPLGLLGLTPLENELDPVPDEVTGGFAKMVSVDPDQPWLGGRWIVETPEGRRLPAGLSMLLFDSSGVNKESALDEHREALISTVEGADLPQADRVAASCAIDWLLYDWLLAHRDGPDSGAVEIRGGVADAAMIVTAADTSAVCRATIDPGLLDLPLS